MNPSYIHENISRISSFFDKRAFRIVFAITAIVFIFFLLVRIAGIFIISPDPWGIIENSVIYSVQRMLAGFPLYADPEQPPYAITQYSPIYYELLYGLAKIFNITPDDPLSIYKISRSVSLVFNLAFSGTLALIATRIFEFRKSVALMIAMVSFLILERHSYSRPDSLFNATIVLAVFTYLLHLKNNSNRIFLVLSAFIGVISIFTKQSGIILPALLLFYHLIILRDLKGIVILFLSFFIFGLLFTWLFLGDDVSLFYKNAVRGLDNGIDLGWYWHSIIIGFFFSSTGLVLTPICIFSSLLLIGSQKKIESFLGWAIIVLFAFAVLTGLKQGSTPSYFIEACGLGLIGLVFIMNRIQLPSILLIIFIVVVLGSVVNDPKILVPVKGKEKYSTETFEKEKEVVQYLQRHEQIPNDAIIFTDLNGWEHFMVNLLYEKGAFPHKDIISQKKVFDYKGFEDLIQQGKVRYLISTRDTLDYLGFDFSGFMKVDEVNGFKIFEPR